MPTLRRRTLLALAAVVLAACADEPLPDISARSPDVPAPEVPATTPDTAVPEPSEAELARATPRELARRFRTTVDRAVADGDRQRAMAEIQRMERYLAELSDEEAARFVSTWDVPPFREWLTSTMRTLQEGAGPPGG